MVREASTVDTHLHCVPCSAKVSFRHVWDALTARNWRKFGEEAQVRFRRTLRRWRHRRRLMVHGRHFDVYLSRFQYDDV